MRVRVGDATAKAPVRSVASRKPDQKAPDHPAETPPLKSPHPHETPSLRTPPPEPPAQALAPSPAPLPHPHPHARPPSPSSDDQPCNSDDEHDPSAAAATHMTKKHGTLSEEIFAEALRERCMEIVPVRPDGNCLFRALALLLYGSEDWHATVRREVLDYAEDHAAWFESFVAAEDFARYVQRKRRDGVHGNHLELAAAAKFYCRPIHVYAYAAEPANIIDGGVAAERPEPLRLSFHRGSHYNCIKVVDMEDFGEVEDFSGDEEALQRAAIALSLADVGGGRGGSSSGAGGSSSGAGGSSSARPENPAVEALISTGLPRDRALEAVAAQRRLRAKRARAGQF